MDGLLSEPQVTTPTRHWHARLELGVERRGDASVAVHRKHVGPLRLQKPLYPEGRDVAHLLVIHPPAGIAGGDRLEVDVAVGPSAGALVTTPGAAKWYRTDGARAHQDVHLRVARGASLEWLPQESIVFDGADAALSTRIDCARDATCIGWDITVLGRQASGERFRRGALRQDLVFAIDGRTIWRERARLAGNDPLLDASVGWAGRHVAGVAWAWGAALSEAQLEACRAVTLEAPRAGITTLADGLLVARALDDSVERVRTIFERLWSIIRPAMTGRDAVPPRIWST